MFIDSHTHLYLDSFSNDRDEVIKRAVNEGVSKMFLPNIDSGTITDMYELSDKYPEQCFPMMGLHPTSVKENYHEELKSIEKQFNRRKFIAIGEIGIDLYWDKTFIAEQKEVFRIQIEWARNLQLPIVIHARDSFDEIFEVLDNIWEDGLTGVFHSFSGDIQQAEKALSYQFYLGINGIITFKNSGLAEVLAEVPIDRILLETDAPFLSPAPLRGKRNESSNILHIAKKISEIYKLSMEQVAGITTRNALNLFKTD